MCSFPVTSNAFPRLMAQPIALDAARWRSAILLNSLDSPAKVGPTVGSLNGIRSALELYLNKMNEGNGWAEYGL